MTDWAVAAAIEIIADVHRYRYALALDLITARLRGVKIDGELKGVRELYELQRLARRSPEQREHQADHLEAIAADDPAVAL